MAIMLKLQYMHFECGIIAINQYRNNIQFENIGVQKFVNKLKNEEGYLGFIITIYFGFCQWTIFYEEEII